MNMQNLLPEFGIRSVTALAVLALAVIAALLAVGSPASAQSSDDGEEIWSSTMTVGSFPIGKGYTSAEGGIGSLTDDTFILGRHTFSVSLIFDRQVSSQLYVGFSNRQANDGEVRAMTLHIGGQTFSFEDATYAIDPDYGHTYEWFLFPSFGWADNDEVAVKITALPMVNVYANDSEAEYKDTVEFEFSRIGNADDSLSFTLSYVQGGETVTRTFPAGKEFFSNFHWASEADDDDNPVCTLTWEVLAGEGYVLGRDPVAEVDIEGPGTTCVSGM